MGITFVYYGMRCSITDEFSHWAIIVRKMIFINDFGTKPGTRLIAPSYPPAVSLFQYVLEMINMKIMGNKYEDWYLYVAYHILLLSLVMPILDLLNKKKEIKLWSKVLFFLSIIVLSLIFCDCAYISVMIDHFVSVAYGTGALYVLLGDFNESIEKVAFSLYCYILAMAKDVGFLFAISLIAIYAYRKYVEQNSVTVKKDGLIKNLIVDAGLVALPSILAKVLWKIEIVVNKTYIMLADSVDFVGLVKYLLSDEENYPKKAVKNYIEKFFDESFELINIEFSYFSLLIVTCIAIAVLFIKLKKKEAGRFNKVFGYSFILIFINVAYILGLCNMYATNFGVDNPYGSELPSFERYLNIDFLGMWIIIIGLMIYLFSINNCSGYIAILASILILETPMNLVSDAATRQMVSKSKHEMHAYDKLAERIIGMVSEGGKVALIPDNPAFDHLVFSYLLVDEDITVVRINDEWEKTQIDNSALEGFKYAIVFDEEEDIEPYINLYKDGVDTSDNLYMVNEDNLLINCNP